jgi:RNA polymerase sigma factor (sigma-70 family)
MNSVLSDARRRKRGATLEQRMNAPAPSDPRSTPSEVHTLVSGLTERQRLVLFLRYYADLDYAAIATALEISPGTVGASLHAAHRTIKQALEEAPA